MVVQKILLAIAVALFLFNIPAANAAQVLFTPALILSEEHTDNLFLDYRNEEDDFITAGGVDLTGQILWRTAGIELNYSPTYNSFKEHENLNYWRHQASLKMWKEYARNTKFELNDSFLRTNDPTDQSQAIEQDGQPQGPVIEADKNRRGRNEYYINVAEGRINHQFGINDRFYAAYQYSIRRDVDTVPGFAKDDNDIVTPSMGLAYDFSQRWGVELDSSYALTDYKDQIDRGEYDGNFRLLYRFDRSISGFLSYRHTILNFEQDAREDYKIYQPSIGIRYDFERNARIEIGAGYYVQDFETSDDKEGFNVTSDLNKRWAYRSGYIGLSGGSGYIIDDNGTRDNGLNLYYQARIEAGYNITSKLTGSVFGAYRYDEYPDETPDRVEKTTSTGLALNWQALQWMGIRCSYDFTDVHSDIVTDEYTENRALLIIRIAPPSPYRLN